MMDEMPDTADIIKPIKFERVTRVPHVFPPAWEHKRVPKCDTAPEQIERECRACGLNRITIMEGQGRRAYRWGDAQYQFDDVIEPDCVRETEIKREAV